jgi:hypothetical protein
MRTRPDVAGIFSLSTDYFLKKKQAAAAENRLSITFSSIHYRIKIDEAQGFRVARNFLRG